MNNVSFYIKIIFLLNYFLYKSSYDITIPKISIFLPIYNKGKYLNRSITSIQKQSLKEIEIIAINDFSTDNTLEVLKEFQKNDKRIKIINNKKNYGLLYSRAMGIKNSRGEYIMNLDPDDELAGNDNLEYLYNKAKKNNVEVLSYSSFFKPNNSTIINISYFLNRKQELIFILRNESLNVQIMIKFYFNLIYLNYHLNPIIYYWMI